MNHSVRFVRALVLAAALPGCSAAEEPSQETETQTADPAASPITARDRGLRAVAPRIASADAAVANVVDSGLPKTSGPILPPEMVTA